MNIFNINFKSLASDILLPPLRQPKQLNWVGSLVSAIQYDWDNFITYWNDLTVRGKYNPQIIVLTAAINRNFPLCLGAAYIMNNALNVPQPYIFNVSDGKFPIYELYAFNVAETVTSGAHNWVFNEAEYIPTYDYTVYVPNSAGYTAAQIIEFVNIYNQLGYTFNVILF